MSLLSDLQAAGVVLEDGVKKIGALLFGVLKQAGKVAEADVVAAIPGAVAALKTYAQAEVKNIASNSAFKNAVGHWQFGMACSLVLQAIERDFPMLATLEKGALQSTIETVVQDEFASLVTASPTVPLSKVASS